MTTRLWRSVPTAITRVHFLSLGICDGLPEFFDSFRSDAQERLSYTLDVAWVPYRRSEVRRTIV